MKYRLPRKVKKAIKKENRELVKKYPFLVPRSALTGTPIEYYDYTWKAWESEMPVGWWKRWGKAYCEDFAQVCKEEGIDLNDVFSYQVKEKFGGLRNYLNICPRSWNEHEYAWEYISEHTCVKCGKFPSPLRDDGWVSAYCDNCHTNKMFKTDDKDYIIDNYPKNRLLEYISYISYKDDKKVENWIDMKPYYDKIGWKYTQDDLISREEMKKYEETVVDWR